FVRAPKTCEPGAAAACPGRTEFAELAVCRGMSLAAPRFARREVTRDHACERLPRPSARLRDLSRPPGGRPKAGPRRATLRQPSYSVVFGAGVRVPAPSVRPPQLCGSRERDQCEAPPKASSVRRRDLARAVALDQLVERLCVAVGEFDAG